MSFRARARAAVSSGPTTAIRLERSPDARASAVRRAASSGRTTCTDNR